MAVETLSQLQLQPNIIIPNDFSLPPPNAMPWQIRPNFQQFQQMAMEVRSYYILKK